MLEPVFGNATVEKVLSALEIYGQVYPSGLAKLFGIPVNGIQQQLKRLEDGGIAVSLMAGKTRLYQFNPRYPFLKELRALIQKGLRYLPQKEIEKYYRNRKRPRRKGKAI